MSFTGAGSCRCDRHQIRFSPCINETESLYHSEVFIAVLGYTDADYSLAISSANGVANNPGGIPTSSNPGPEVTPQSPVNDVSVDADDSGGNSGGGSLHLGMFVLMLIGAARRRRLQILQDRATFCRAAA